jgi:hypothetical protein
MEISAKAAEPKTRLVMRVFENFDMMLLSLG